MKIHMGLIRPVNVKLQGPHEIWNFYENAWTDQTGQCSCSCTSTGKNDSTELSIVLVLVVVELQADTARQNLTMSKSVQLLFLSVKNSCPTDLSGSAQHAKEHAIAYQRVVMIPQNFTWNEMLQWFWITKYAISEMLSEIFPAVNLLMLPICKWFGRFCLFVFVCLFAFFSFFFFFWWWVGGWVGGNSLNVQHS